MYNTEIISYLIGTFTDLVNTFGKKPETVKYYKTQVVNLVKINQLPRNECEFVFKLLDIVNKNQIEWDNTENRVKQFNEAMTVLLSSSPSKREIVAYQLYTGNTITKYIYEKVCDVLDIDVIECNTNTNTNMATSNKGFGVLDRSETLPEKEKEIIDPCSGRSMGFGGFSRGC